MAVAAFDTRIEVEKVSSRLLHVMARLFGFAAEPIADKLRKKGGRPAGEPGRFIVEGTEGPMGDGELERAGQRARGLTG